MEYDYTIVSMPDDFYLSDTIRRELEKRGKKCLFCSEVPGASGMAYKYMYKSPIPIAVVNSEFLEKVTMTSFVEFSSKADDTEICFVLLSEPNLTLPSSWRKIETIDVFNGLNSAVLDALLVGVPAPQLASQSIIPSATSEIPQQEEDDVWELQRHSHPTISELMLANDHGELSMTVQRALRYLTGEGVPQDSSRTVSLLSKAIEENTDDVTALYYMGACCETGLVSDKASVAADYYQKAANLGHMPSIVRLAFSIMEENSEEAAALLNQARGKGVCEASYGLGLIAERTEKFEDAVEYYSEAAELGNAPAQNALACLYVEGKGVSDNDDCAFQWFELAANQGLIDAVANLGIVLASREDEASLTRSEQLLRQAAAAGNVQAAKSVRIIDQNIAEAKRQAAREERRRRAQAESESSDGSDFLSGLLSVGKNVGSYAFDRIIRGN